MKTTRSEPAEGTSLACQCALPLSRQTLTFVADLLRGHLKKIGSRWRKLPPGKIALIVLAALRHDHRVAGMAGGNEVSASTISRRTWEIIQLLAARAPRLDRAPAKVKNDGGEAVLLDGTLIPTRRRSGTANRRNFNGKHKKHGLLSLALTDENGNLAWISAARRGAASGGDIGARVAVWLAARHPERVIGGHVTSNVLWSDVPGAELSPAERAYADRMLAWDRQEGGYMHIQETKPLSLAHGLADSPADWPRGSPRSGMPGADGTMTSSGAAHLTCSVL